MVTNADYEAYQARNCAAIQDLLNGTGTRPVLFLGSGVTRRYLGAPSWLELLIAISAKAGMTGDQYNFIAQKAGNNPAVIGSFLVDPIHEWAWSTGKNYFPAEYFTASTEKAIFLKHLAAEHLKSFGPLPATHPLTDEIELLKKIAPHAIITTNFDTFVPDLFAGFEAVVGEQIIPMSMSIMGELYQIHGSVADPSTLVLTQEDYDRFMKKRRYISSKMMTYFAEYPVFILGYGLGDANVNAIISDLGEAMKDKGGLLDNVYYVEWTPDVLALPHLKEEHVVPVEPGLAPALRVRTIVTSEFEWVLRALADMASPVPINTKLLRHLAARVVNLVRTDVPKNKVEIDYSRIEKLSDDTKELAMVFGISNVSNPNVDYPYLLTQVAQKLGYNYWAHAQKLLVAANKKLGFDIKSSDNEYHMAFKSGLKQATHKYSEKLVDLLKALQQEQAKKSATAPAHPEDAETFP
ncbi:SIR2 family protein [Rhodopseudomonas palustris]|uniref:SIR2 family NAD-dependent protein deacylase n=1 Tax=Rhodopseudomonas palustris TaxID=1076 RepID=UPI0020CC2A24|nr:SIR2 family protein [Rhodopseudomonas palustris]MCP9629608.1 SIR2 family protein [Rhodopseudomonas palustris]